MKKLLKIKSVLPVFLLAAILAATSGCALFVVGAAAGAGAAGYAYVSGELKTTQSNSLDQVWSATQSAMNDLEFPIVSRKKDALQAELVARNSADKKIVVDLKKVSDTATEIRIRVGAFGDEAISRTILEKIQSHL